MRSRQPQHWRPARGSPAPQVTSWDAEWKESQDDSAGLTLPNPRPALDSPLLSPMSSLWSAGAACGGEARGVGPEPASASGCFGWGARSPPPLTRHPLLAYRLIHSETLCPPPSVTHRPHPSQPPHFLQGALLDYSRSHGSAVQRAPHQVPNGPSARCHVTPEPPPPQPEARGSQSSLYVHGITRVCLLITQGLGPKPQNCGAGVPVSSASRAHVKETSH